MTQRQMRAMEAFYQPLDRPYEPPAPSTRAKPVQREAQIQGAVAALLDVYKNQRKLTWWPVPSGIAIVGGTKEDGARRGAILRSRGLRRPGVADIGLCFPPFGHYACIELKAPGGKLSPAQVEFLADIARMGGLRAVCESVDEVKATVDTWLAAEAATAAKRAADAAKSRSEAV